MKTAIASILTAGAALAAYARIGDVSQAFRNTTHTLKARSTYVAATARLPLTETISVGGKLSHEVSASSLSAGVRFSF
jgi:hypothetical protein